MTRTPKEKELLQMPGRGALDFRPLLAALRDIRFANSPLTDRILFCFY